MFLGAHGKSRAAIPEVDQGGNPLECDISGWFNTGWGFGLQVPDGLAGCNLEMHDTIIPLGSRREDRLITTSGYYNAGCSSTVAEWVDSLVNVDPNDPQRSDVRIIRRQMTRLGGQDAERVVYRYRDKGSNREMTEDVVTAFSRKQQSANFCEKAAESVFSLTLTTPTVSYRQDLRVFERVIKSCKSTDG